jgi:hypothetical protein
MDRASIRPPAPARGTGRHWRLVPALVLAGLLAACGSAPQAPGPAPIHRLKPCRPRFLPLRPAQPRKARAAASSARTAASRFIFPHSGDTLQGVAARLLGDPSRAWRIAEANGQVWEPQAGRPLVVPLGNGNAIGVNGDGVQTVPILCYHRFGSGSSKMLVAPSQFEAQLEWLARNHYKVLRLRDLSGFLAGREALPQRSVVITIDDGYESVYRHAYPALKKHSASRPRSSSTRTSWAHGTA